MKRILNKLGFLFDLIKKRKFAFLWSGISKRVYSKELSYVLTKDLNIDSPTPAVRIKLNIRHYKDEDAIYFKDDEYNHGLIKKQIKQCIVATKDNIPVYRVWLMDASQNKKIQEFWGPFFAPLKPNEVLFENSYTVPNQRGFGVMSSAKLKVIEYAKNRGAETAITYIESNQIASLRANHNAGFRPLKIRTQKWLFFRQTISYYDITNNMMTKYKKTTEARKNALIK